MCLLLHAVDVSHPTKSWELHKEWTARCMEEFFRQGDKERELGLDISPLCDRDSTQVPQSQIGFINYIVSPLFDVFSEVINYVLDRKDETDPWHPNLELNRKGWNDKILAGELDLEPSGAAEDVFPPAVSLARLENGSGEKRTGGAVAGGETPVDSLDNRHLIKQIGPIRITSKPPDKPTRHRDVIAEVSANIISKPGSPESWGFTVKESITTGPPRPQSASLLSPPEKRCEV